MKHHLLASLLIFTSLAPAEPLAFSMGTQDPRFDALFSSHGFYTANNEGFRFANITETKEGMPGWTHIIVAPDGKTGDAWFLQEGGLGGSFLRELPEDSQSLAAYFVNESALGFGVFDKDTLDPEFITSKSISPPRPGPWPQMLPLTSGRAAFMDLFDDHLGVSVIELDGRVSTNIKITGDGIPPHNNFRFNSISEAADGSGLTINWLDKLEEPDSNRLAFFTMKLSNEGEVIWSNRFETLRHDSDYRFPLADGGYLYVIPETEEQTLLVKIKGDGSLGFARRIALSHDHPSSFQEKDDALFLGLRKNDLWAFMKLNRDTGTVERAIGLKGLDELVSVQILEISDTVSHLYLEGSPRFGKYQGHFVRIPPTWETAEIHSVALPLPRFPVGLALGPFLNVSRLDSGETFVTYIKPFSTRRCGMILNEKMEAPTDDVIENIASSLTIEEVELMESSALEEIAATFKNTSVTISEAPGQFESIDNLRLSRVVIDLSPHQVRPATLTTRLERTGNGFKISFQSIAGLEYQLMETSQFDSDFSPTGDPIRGNSREMFFEFPLHIWHDTRFFVVRERKVD